MNQKIILLSGSTSGIGKAAALEIVKVCKVLILPVRNIPKGESLKQELLIINPNCQIDIMECDFGVISSIKKFANEVNQKYEYIDVLANNAGIFNSSKIISIEGLEQTFVTNVMSQFVLNNMLLDLVQKSQSGRIVNMSSLGHKGGNYDIDNLQGEKEQGSFQAGTKFYLNSNLFRNMLSFWQAEELTKNGSNITVNCMHPGAIATGLGQQIEGFWEGILLKIFGLFTKPAADGAKTLVFLCINEECQNITGKYWSNCKIDNPSPKSTDLTKSKELWSKCKEIMNKN